jgi:hypothetical protein
MKVFTKLLGLLLLIPSISYATPVSSVDCNPGSEHGYSVIFQMSRKHEYQNLIIHRKNQGTDYKRDLVGYKGGKYRLDLTAHGGITGYTVIYKGRDDADFVSHQGIISCAQVNLNTDI